MYLNISNLYVQTYPFYIYKHVLFNIFFFINDEIYKKIMKEMIFTKSHTAMINRI